MTINYLPLYKMLAEYKVDQWSGLLPEQVEKAFSMERHGDYLKWMRVIDALPSITPSVRQINRGTVTIGRADDLTPFCQVQVQDNLQRLHPWRKGPYALFGIMIDAEWRSDWKWNRLAEHISPLPNRLVLDVGCGNGYHCWRMLGAGAKMVIGIDPILLNNLQFQAIRKLYGEAPVYVIPVGIEDLPYGLRLFDTVFSMGVFYHRRSPIDHLMELKDSLRSGGELVLETLVIDAQHGQLLLPPGRYAKMRNVWFIPSCATLISWMRRCGFINIRLVDVSKTTVQEQRSTAWMRFQSLQHFLDPNDPELTVEGLPAPLRAIILANVK